jgi:type I restriction enzyme R subunit
MPVAIEEYKARLAAKLVEQAHTLEEFRNLWVDPPSRRELIDLLVGAGYSPTVIRMVDDKEEYDLYDILGELGWGLMPRTRRDRALAFNYKHEVWIDSLPKPTAATVRAIAGQFAYGGIEGLENPEIFETPEVRRAGGLAALKSYGDPAELLRETKVRMFAA